MVDDRRIEAFVRQLHPVSTATPLVRIGADRDGGYLVPDDLEGIVACFSPGVGNVAEFELGMTARGIPCHLVDASVDAPPILHELIGFEKKFLGVDNDDRTIRLEDWVASRAPSGDLLLQMDIEGGEWAVLLDASPEVLRRFRVVVMEIHGLDRLLDEHGFSTISTALDRLLGDFHLVHAHPNNYVRHVVRGDMIIPPVLEVTFLRKDRADATGYATHFPHPLDRPNTHWMSAPPLPAPWHR